MVVNPESLTRKIVSLHPDMIEAINEFRHANRISTESEAIRRLLAFALEASRVKSDVQT
jgi:metal-responsive CopG/Arc/MetJ family transcriptional regulator